jgi:hypothetical protein
MAAVSNAIRFGSNQALAAPAYDDLYLPVFGGEVLKRYDEYLTATKFLQRRTITSGNTARFPRLGGIGAERHAVGTKLLGLDAEQTQISITLDERPLVSHFRLDDIDEAMAHFEVRSEMARQAGLALAEADDQYSLRLLINASRETETTMYGGASSSFPGGGYDLAGAAYSSSDFRPTMATAVDEADVSAHLTALDLIAEEFDQRRVGFANRHLIVDVPAWHAMARFGSPRSAADLNNGRTPLFQATDGTYGSNPNPGNAESQVPDFQRPLVFNGWHIWRSNILGANIMGVDLSADDEAKYQGDFTLTRGICFQGDAVAKVVLLNVMSEAERDVSRQDYLFVTKMLGGGGTLRPEAAVELIYT